MSRSSRLVARMGGALIAVWLGATVVQAELRWIDHTIKHDAGINEKVVEASFVFENIGSSPVTILSIKSSCGCTTASPSKQTYAPGESGAIEAVFEIGDRLGHQNKAIWITTDERPDNPFKLTLLVAIPSLLQIEPRIVWWSIGGDLKEQTILIKVHPDAQVIIEGIESSNNGITHRLDSVSPLLHKLSLKPVSTEKKLRTTLNLKVRQEGGSTRSFALFARVN